MNHEYRRLVLSLAVPSFHRGLVDLMGIMGSKLRSSALQAVVTLVNGLLFFPGFELALQQIRRADERGVRWVRCPGARFCGWARQGDRKCVKIKKHVKTYQ